MGGQLVLRGTHGPRTSCPRGTRGPRTSCPGGQLVLGSRVRGDNLRPSYDNGTWLMEGAREKRVPALVARALVNTNTSQIPVRLLNPGAEPVQVFKGMEVAVLELVDIPGEVVISNVGSDTISQEKREMLRGLAETQGAGLTMEQREQFYSLLLT